MTVLVDSDVLVEVSRGRNAEIITRWTELSNSDSVILYSPVSAAELWAGARPGESEYLTRLFRTLTCVPLGAEAGQQAGAYLKQFGKSHGVELGDALIAAASALYRAQLWTRNRKHYPMKEVVFFS